MIYKLCANLSGLFHKLLSHMLSISIYLYLSIYLSIYSYIYRSMYLSIYLYCMTIYILYCIFTCRHTQHLLAYKKAGRTPGGILSARCTPLQQPVGRTRTYNHAPYGACNRPPQVKRLRTCLRRGVCFKLNVSFYLVYISSL